MPANGGSRTSRLSEKKSNLLGHVSVKIGGKTEGGYERAPMSAFRKPAIEAALALGCLASLSVGCRMASAAEPVKAKSLPASVRGVPMLELAKHALGAAEAYSVSKPFNVRAVITTQAALYAQLPTAGDRQTESTS